MKKTTGGRQKIEIKKIEKSANRQVTFTKRRHGLFNKASELCVLTGAEMTVLVQSKGGRVFAFGHPSADSVIDAYLENTVPNSTLLSENPIYMQEACNKEYEKICKELEVEKNKSKSSVEESDLWWENSFENLEIDELETFINSMEELKLNMAKKADKLKNTAGSTSSEDIIDGLIDEGLLDEILSNNIDDANEDLMINFNSNGELILNNHDDEHNHVVNNLQVQDDFGTFEVPDDFCFEPNQIQSEFGTF